MKILYNLDINKFNQECNNILETKDKNNIKKLINGIEILEILLNLQNIPKLLKQIQRSDSKESIFSRALYQNIKPQQDDTAFKLFQERINLLDETNVG